MATHALKQLITLTALLLLVFTGQASADDASGVLKVTTDKGDYVSVDFFEKGSRKSVSLRSRSMSTRAPTRFAS